MTELLLIRHGETDWNAEKRLQGHLDIPLNATGVRQAAALGEALRHERVDAVFSSDLQRALKTAEPIARHYGLTIQRDPVLRERCYGAFEGLRYADISVRYPEAYASWQARDVDARYPGGVREAETLREFSLRSVEAVKRLAAACPNRKIVILTHGGVLECVYRAAKKIGLLPPRNFEIRNAAINRMFWNGADLQVSQWGDVTHLASLALDEVDK